MRFSWIFPWGAGWVNLTIQIFKKVIRAAFKLFETSSGPVLEDFPETIPVLNGRMGYALPPSLY